MPWNNLTITHATIKPTNQHMSNKAKDSVPETLAEDSMPHTAALQPVHEAREATGQAVSGSLDIQDSTASTASTTQENLSHKMQANDYSKNQNTNHLKAYYL